MIRVYDAAGDVHPAVQPSAAFEPDAINIEYLERVGGKLEN
jgi:hypothetical protein